MKRLLIFLLGVVSSGGAQFTHETTVKITLDVLKQLHSSSVYFLHSEDQGTLHMPRFVMSVVRQGIPATQIRAEALGSLAHRRANSLYVAICSDRSPENLLPQLPTASELPRGKRLVFVDEAVSLEEFFAGTYIPFDSEFLVAQTSPGSRGRGVVDASLTEVYHVHPTLPLQIFRIGNWSSVAGLSWSSVPFVRRRGDLHGTLIKGALRPQAPYIIKTKYRHNKPIEFSGFSMRIFNEFRSRMNFTADCVVPPDGAYGFRDANGTWNGVVGMVATDEVEFGLSLFSFVKERMDVIDYLPPILSPKLVVYIRRPNAQQNTLRHISSPFTAPLWGAVVTTMLTLVVTLSVMWYIGPERETTDYSMKHCWFYVFGIFCQQGQASAPAHWSCRAVCVTAYLTAVVTTAAYSATFISFLSVRRYSLPFADYDGLVRDGTYRLGVNRATGHVEFFRDSSDPVMRQIYTQLLEPEVRTSALPETDLEGLQRLCADGRYSYLTLDTSFKGLEADIPCHVVEVAHAFHTTTLSMIISKSSRYRALFSHHMQEMRRTGVLKRFVRSTWASKVEILEESLTPVSVDMITMLLTLPAGGVVAALLSFVLEMATLFLPAYRNSNL